MRKSSSSRPEPTETEKAAAVKRALKKIEDRHAKPRTRRDQALSVIDQVQSEVRSRFTSEEAYEAWKEESLRQSREHMEAWMRNPPWFNFYDPYASVFSGGVPEFFNAKGEKLEFYRPSSARQLLYLAKSAADEYLAGNTLTKDEWKKALDSWKQIVKDLRIDIAKKNFQFRDPLGDTVTPNFDELSPFQVLSIAHQVFAKNWNLSEETKISQDGEVGIGAFHQLWCVICLSEVDSALLSTLYEDAGDGMDSAIRATEALGYAREYLRLIATALTTPAADQADREPFVVPLRHEFALAGAKAKLAKDPKQAAKREVKEWWIRWRANPTWYQGKSSFARAMLDKFPVLSSQPVIETWCRQWERGEHSVKD